MLDMSARRVGKNAPPPLRSAHGVYARAFVDRPNDALRFELATILRVAASMCCVPDRFELRGPARREL
jgi:hypothetical protein